MFDVWQNKNIFIFSNKDKATVIQVTLPSSIGSNQGVRDLLEFEARIKVLRN